MVVAFCGHANYRTNLKHKEFIFETLNALCPNDPIDFFLGEYGNFDSFAYNCAKEFKLNHPFAKLVFISPYMPSNLTAKDISKANRFDSMLYPPLENIPPKFAISHRNRWIAQNADLIFAYVTHEYGGAYAMYRYAKRTNATIYNLADQIK